MDQRIIYIAVLVLVIVVGMNYIPKEPWNFSEIVHEEGYGIYLMEEEDIDVTNPSILNTAYQIKQESTSPMDAIRKTAQFVYENIEYDASTSISYCYDETASSVLQAGFGDCVSMSRLTVALLRAQGVPARTAGGCLTTDTCVATFSVIPFAEAQVTPMQEGDFKKRGFLHEWVEVWEPSRGWFILEPTSGQIFDLSCDTYLQHHYDDNPFDRCVIMNQTFWDTCYAS